MQFWATSLKRPNHNRWGFWKGLCKPGTLKLKSFWFQGLCPPAWWLSNFTVLSSHLQEHGGNAGSGIKP